MTSEQFVHKIYGLWPTIEAMASTLDASPGELRQARDAGRLPPAEYDPLIAIFSMTSEGRHVSVTQLARHRYRLRNKVLNEERAADRRQLIRDFYDACGGVRVVASDTGISENSLHINSYRGYLPRARRYEFETLAAKRKVQLPASLFEKV